MSTYVVTDATINRIINQLTYARRDSWQQEYLVEPLSKHCPNLVPSSRHLPDDDDWRWGLGHCMREMNEEACRQRYGDNDMAPEGPYTYEFKAEHITGGPVAALKALDCFMYQCSEGRVPELPLFKALEEVGNRLARQIVNSLPQYEAAKWG